MSGGVVFQLTDGKFQEKYGKRILTLQSRLEKHWDVYSIPSHHSNNNNIAHAEGMSIADVGEETATSPQTPSLLGSRQSSLTHITNAPIKGKLNSNQ